MSEINEHFNSQLELLEDNNKLATSSQMKKYHLMLKRKVKESLLIANTARQKGFDPKKEVEIYLAQDAAMRTEGLVGPKGVAKRLKEMEEKHKLTKDEIVVEIAKEIAQGQFGKMTNEELAEQAIRTSLSYQTEGITAAPIEGISKVRIKNNPDGSPFLAVYYSGPIRSAGGTAQGVSVYLADVVRRELNLNRYLASEHEVERMLEETRLYNKIMHLQLPTSDEELRYAWKNVPIMIQGDPTESDEVNGYRDIDNMETNRVRGGACLVFNDGLVGRAKKITKRTKKLHLEGWEWLEEIAKGKYSDRIKTEDDKSSDQNNTNGKTHKTKKRALPDYSFAADALMGRPTFSDASADGGFRLRYGHARCTGIAGVGIHPGVMAAVNDFLASGTHIRTERPGKGSIVAPIDTIRPPVVLLENGDVVEIPSYEYGVKIQPEIKEILFLGDILVGFGEFLQNNYKLCPVGYNDEWWLLELEKAGCDLRKPNEQKMEFYARMMRNPPQLNEAIQYSKKYGVPLHPKYTVDWRYLNQDEIKQLHQSLWKTSTNTIDLKCKKILEKAMILHKKKTNGLDIGKFRKALELQLPKDIEFPEYFEDGYDIVSSFSAIKIRDTVGTTIGTRMGRPEKAKGRKMKPQLHGLFPLGSEKSVKRELSRAIEMPYVTVKLGNRYCNNCNLFQYQIFCKNCREKTQLKGICSKCRENQDEGPCDICGSRVYFTKRYQISISELMNEVHPRISNLPKVVKLKSQIENPSGTAELLDKGIIRARYDLNVFRDGTVRYDSTDAPLTHFYPREINVSIKKLNEIGYTHDVYGNVLENENQLLEIKPQDIIVHVSSIEYLTNVSKFVDDELQQIYGLPRYYNINNHEDLVGHLVIALAPHTSAGVIGRILGFTTSSVCWAHPYWHSSKRRNADGDEDGIILLLDGFLNFSKEYLPSSRGSKMDTPLVLVVTLNPAEVDDEAFNLDCVTNYNLQLYEDAIQMKMPFEVGKKIERIESRLGKPEQYEGFVFTHSTRNISEGPLMTKYKDSDLGIRDKLEEQLSLARKIRAVDKKETALRILEKHALPDLMGNLRAFASQSVRCVSCNTKYRRAPLSGKCLNKNCTKGKLVLTVPPKAVSKYYDICKELVYDFNLGIYYEDRLEKIKIALDSHFPEKELKQLDLSQWL